MSVIKKSVVEFINGCTALHLRIIWKWISKGGGVVGMA